MQHCQICGSNQPEHARFCSNCGQRLLVSEESAAAITTPSEAIFPDKAVSTQEPAVFAQIDEFYAQPPSIVPAQPEQEAVSSQLAHEQGESAARGPETPYPPSLPSYPEAESQPVYLQITPPPPPKPFLRRIKPSTITLENPYATPRHRSWWSLHGLHGGFSTIWIVGVLILLLITSGIGAAFALLPANLSLISGSDSVAMGGMLHLHGQGFIPGGDIVLLLDDRVALTPQGVHAARALRKSEESSAASSSLMDASGHVQLLSSAKATLSVSTTGTFDAIIAVSEQWSLGLHKIHAKEGGELRNAVFSFTVLPKPARLTIAPSFLDIGQLEAGQRVILPVMLDNSGGQRLHWVSDTSGTRWLDVLAREGELQSAGLQQAIDLVVDTTHLNVGHYFSSLRVSSNGGEKRIGVSLNVIPPHAQSEPAKLNIISSGLDFGTRTVGTQATMQVVVSNLGAQKLNWKVDIGKTTWLAVDKTTGTIKPSGQPQMIYVTVDTTKLSVGTYSAMLQLHSNGGNKQVRVSLVVVPLALPSLSTQPSAHAPSPMLLANPTGLNGNVDCSYTQGQGWMCVTMLSNARNAQSALNWSASSMGIGGINFYPAKGVLLPGQSIQVDTVMQDMHCPALATLIFTGPANAVKVPWSCTPPPPTLLVSPLSFNASTDCTAAQGKGWICPATLSNVNALSTLSWSASSSGMSGTTFFPQNGLLGAGQTMQVNITVPSNITCPATAIFSFKGPVNTTTVPWNCIPSRLAVNSSNLDFGTLMTGTKKTLSVIVSNNGGQQLSWNADTAGAGWLTLDKNSGQLQPGDQHSIQVMADTTQLVTGNYSVSLHFSSDGGSAEVHVALSVTNQPRCTLVLSSSTGQTFVTTPGSNPASQSFTLSTQYCTGSVNISPTVTTGSDWLAVTSNLTTIAPGGKATLTSTVISANLNPDSYSGVISLAAMNGGQIVDASTLGVMLQVAFPPQGNISLSNIDSSACLQDSNGNWKCTVGVSGSQSNQGKLNWSVSSDVPGVTFSTSSGSLSPGQSTQTTISIPNTACGSGSFTFTFQGNTIVAPWNCSMGRKMETALDTCSYATNAGWNCLATVISPETNTTSLNWSVSNSGMSGVSVSPSSGMLTSGQSVQVTILIPDTICPASTTLTFVGPDNNISLPWSCAAPTLTVSAPGGANQAQCTQGSDGSYACTNILALAPGSQGMLNWSASSNVPGVTFSTPYGTLSPGVTESVTAIVPPNTCTTGSFTYSGGGTNTITIPWSCPTTPTPTATATDTPTPVSTASGTSTPTTTVTDTPTLTMTATDTPTATATDTPTATATDTPTPTATDTPTPTATDTPTPVPTATDTPIPVTTDTPSPGITATSFIPSLLLVACLCIPFISSGRIARRKQHRIKNTFFKRKEEKTDEH